MDLPCDPDLFDLLVCPCCRSALKWSGTQLLCTDAACRRAYRVDDGIPVMLADESSVLAEDGWSDLMRGPGPVGGGLAAVDARAQG